ncbi:MAG: hypothetical protein HOQ10_02075 [Frateuria sp.]|uniref:hypothetical protein n=1 Tax=Frateuria sp. TaxID=2211372 RepID=UPI0018100CA3|nr:hypothetical protein [Frateuria sp.]NUO71489.1 hypothetical protein [Frateuria sp.]NUR23721.1 hypothetical protein [Frateuria sp.]
MPACRSQAFALWLATGAGLWWLLGAFLLALTPLPAHTESLGWAPLYWLLLAPPCVLAGLRLRRLAFAAAAG